MSRLSLSLLVLVLAAVAVAGTVITNPVMPGVADPDILRVDDPVSGLPTYFLTHTSGMVDFPLYTSSDLLSWKKQATGLLGVSPTGPANTLYMNGYWYCWNWAPDLRPSPAGGYILSFTSSRFSENITSCPSTDEGMGIYFAWSKTPYGPFFDPSDPTFPRPLGASLDPKVCPAEVRNSLPHSPVIDTPRCVNGLLCNNTARLDGDLFNDPMTNTSWFSYAWFTNPLPISPWEKTQAGEHVSIVKLDRNDPRGVVPCDPKKTTKVWLQTPHDSNTMKKLANYCPRCKEYLSWSKGRLNETMSRGGVTWGVVEGPMIFRRNNFVYALLSHSAWDSSWYSIMFVAAPSVEELDVRSPHRIVGRFLIPSNYQSFGHGTAVLGPDNKHWYYIHHHLDHTHCLKAGIPCERDLYISPLNFEDHHDGKGDVWIKPIFPAENLKVDIIQPGEQQTEDEQQEQQEKEEEEQKEEENVQEPKRIRIALE